MQSAIIFMFYRKQGSMPLAKASSNKSAETLQTNIFINWFSSKIFCSKTPRTKQNPWTTKPHLCRVLQSGWSASQEPPPTRYSNWLQVGRPGCFMATSHECKQNCTQYFHYTNLLQMGWNAQLQKEPKIALIKHYLQPKQPNWVYGLHLWQSATKSVFAPNGKFWLPFQLTKATYHSILHKFPCLKDQ